MTSDLLWHISPLVALAVAAVGILVMLCFTRSHTGSVALCVAGLGAAFWLTIQAGSTAAAVRSSDAAPTLLMTGGYSAYFWGLIFAAGIAVALLSYDYFRRLLPRNHGLKRSGSDEYYVLILLACLGSAVLAASTHFVSFFLGLEILSACLFVLMAYRPGDALGIEGGTKYLVLASVSSALLLFGMALVYARWGTMDLGRLARDLQMVSSGAGLLTLAGLALILVGIAFKLAIVPMHLWTADVYQAAPAPVTAFVASVSKGAVFVLLLRYFSQLGYGDDRVLLALMVLAVLTMVVGNVLALRENNIKRLLAYSSIAQVGYILVPFIAGRWVLDAASQAVAFYLLAYMAMSLGALGVVSVLSPRDRDAERIEDYRGLFFDRPLLAAVLSLMLMSLAGLPLTAGFVGKLMMAWAGVSAELWALVVLLVLASAVSVYYYLRVVAVMFSHRENGQANLPLAHKRQRVHAGAAITLAVLTVVILFLGIWPAPVLELIRELATLTPP